jgi:hypothetical protein
MFDGRMSLVAEREQSKGPGIGLGKKVSAIGTRLRRNSGNAVTCWALCPEKASLFKNGTDPR